MNNYNVHANVAKRVTSLHMLTIQEYCVVGDDDIKYSHISMLITMHSNQHHAITK